jgi:DNA-binding NarL/FixJ family response regulator
MRFADRGCEATTNTRNGSLVGIMSLLIDGNVWGQCQVIKIFQSRNITVTSGRSPAARLRHCAMPYEMISISQVIYFTLNETFDFRPAQLEGSSARGSAVRSIVHLGSNDIGEDVIAGKQPTRVTAASRTVKSGEKNGTSPLSPLVQEVCPSAPIDIPAFDIEQIARVGRIAERDAVPTTAEEDAVMPERFAPATAGQSAATSAADVSDRPAIVVIHRRDFFRDCFVRCLNVAYGDRIIGSFASIADWCASWNTDASPVAVVIVIMEAGEEAELSNSEFIDRTEGKIPVIIVSDVDDHDHVVETLKRGARGYIPSSLPFNIAVQAVRLVEAGGIFVPASSLVERGKPAAAAAKAAAPFTERQMMVLEEIRHGKANKQIAYALKMSEHTVKLHLRHIMRKLNARNRTEVAILSETLLAGQKGA